MKATHLISIEFYDNFPDGYSEETIRALILERFRLALGDKLENIIIKKS